MKNRNVLVDPDFLFLTHLILFIWQNKKILIF